MRQSGELELVAVDNANPGTIVNFPDESRMILRALAAAVTPGDTLPLGVESLIRRFSRATISRWMPQEPVLPCA